MQSKRAPAQSVVTVTTQEDVINEDFEKTEAQATLVSRGAPVPFAENASHEATLRRIFDVCDRDKNGTLDLDETFEAMKCFGVSIDTAGVRRLVNEITEVAGADSTQVLTTAPPQFNEGRRGSCFLVSSERGINFEEFKKMIAIWQCAARFQMFEGRTSETNEHIAALTATRFILPGTAAMWWWEVVMLVTATYMLGTAIGVFYTATEERAGYFAATTASDGIVSIVLFCDMMRKFLTCAVRRRGDSFDLIDDLKSIAREYMTSVWFWIDLLTVMPLRFLCAAGGDPTYLLRVDNATDALLNARESGCVGCVTGADYEAKMIGATVLTVIRALKYVEHYRYFAETSLTPMTRWYIWRQFVLSPAVSAFSYFVLSVHGLSVMYLSLVVSKRGVKATTSEVHHSYAQGVYLVMYCMSTAGLGDVVPGSDSARLYFILLCILGTLFNAFVVGSVVSFYQRSEIEGDRQKKLLELSNLLLYFEVPDNLCEEIISFQNYLSQNSLMKTYHYIVRDLPLDVQQNLELCTRIHAVNNVPVLKDAHQSAKFQLCNLMVPIIFCPEEYVFVLGEIGEEMFFINHGFVNITNEKNDLLATLKPGSCFGEITVFLRSPVHRTANARCITYAECFVLLKSEFSEVVERYPRLKQLVDEFCFAQEFDSKVNHIAQVVRKESLVRRRSAEESFDVERNAPMPRVNLDGIVIERSDAQEPSHVHDPSPHTQPHVQDSRTTLAPIRAGIDENSFLSIAGAHQGGQSLIRRKRELSVFVRRKVVEDERQDFFESEDRRKSLLELPLVVESRIHRPSLLTATELAPHPALPTFLAMSTSQIQQPELCVSMASVHKECEPPSAIHRTLADSMEQSHSFFSSMRGHYRPVGKDQTLIDMEELEHELRELPVCKLIHICKGLLQHSAETESALEGLGM